MLVVIIIGLVLLGVGTSLFYKAYGGITEAKDTVDKRSESILNALMDDGGIIVVAFNSKDTKRGKYADFAMAINNELGENRTFQVLVTYDSSSAYPEGGPPFNPIPTRNYYNLDEDLRPCPGDKEPENCGQAWILMLSEFSEGFKLENNARMSIPIIINVPKNANSGQYIFNVDVCVSETPTGSPDCNFQPDGKLINRYGSRQKLYVNI